MRKQNNTSGAAMGMIKGAAKGRSCLPSISIVWIILTIVRALSMSIMILVLVSSILFNVRAWSQLGTSNTIFQFVNRIVLCLISIVIVIAEFPASWGLTKWVFSNVVPMLNEDHGFGAMGCLQICIGSFILGFDYTGTFLPTTARPTGGASAPTQGEAIEGSPAAGRAGTAPIVHAAPQLSLPDRRLVDFILASGYLALSLGLVYMLLGIGGASLKKKRKRMLERGLIMDGLAQAQMHVQEQPQTFGRRDVEAYVEEAARGWPMKYARSDSPTPHDLYRGMAVPPRPLRPAPPPSTPQPPPRSKYGRHDVDVWSTRRG